MFARPDTLAWLLLAAATGTEVQRGSCQAQCAPECAPRPACYAAACERDRSHRRVFKLSPRPTAVSTEATGVMLLPSVAIDNVQAVLTNVSLE